MRVLITGATGFVGSHVTDLLFASGEQVAILRRQNSSTWRIGDSLPHVTQIEGDLLDLQASRKQILDFEPEAVIHLAWYGVENSFRNDEDQVGKNLLSSVALVKLAREAGCKTFIGMGSQAEYGQLGDIISEDAPTNPTTIYGTTKLCTYMLIRSLLRETDMRFVWMRLFSSYGPKDNETWMLPSLIGKLLRGEKPPLTAGEQRWDYVHVRDVASAIYHAMTTPSAEGVYNIGSGQARVLRSIVEMVRDSIDPKLELGFGEVPYRPDQVMHLQADITRLANATGWKPKISLEAGLAETVEWYRKEARA